MENPFENLPEPDPIPEHKPLSIRHVAVIAGRDLRPGDLDALPWMVRAMATPVVAGMGRPIGAKGEAMVEGLAELCHAPVVVVARAMLKAMQTLRIFSVADVLELVEQERRATEAAAVDDDFDEIPEA